MTLPIADEAKQAIIGYEVSSQQVYNQRYQQPTWPEGASGVTIGIGYDLGYETHEQLEKDWDDILPADVLTRLDACVGEIGPKAAALIPGLRDIRIPYGAALSVFEHENIPRYSDMTERAFPRCADLSPLSFGALVSLVFNRGPGMTDPPGDTQSRRLEMRQIRDAMIERRYADIPDYIDAMKRLWNNGLVARREAEADMFRRGLI